MAAGELTPPKAEDTLLGKVISDRYRVIKKLGEGGMGAVYLAEHVFIEKKVALKVLAPELSRKPDLTARFLQEAKSASRIGHENVIDISDFGQSPEGLVYFAMEYLKGQDLGQLVRAEGALPWRRARPIILQICEALGAAHGRGIIHRDMKPENVFLIEKGGRSDFVKLLDFGIAKVQSPGEGGPKLTQTGMIFGTPEYMAPEQAEGKVCDQRADIYAVGCVIHHLITGEPPFQADSFVAMLTKHLMEPPRPPSQGRPQLGITPELDALVLKALSKSPDQRPQTMAELIAAVRAIPEGEQPRVTSPAGGSEAPASNRTRQMGGSDAQAIIATSERVSNTAMMASGPSPFERTELASPRGRGKLAFVAVGVGVGLAVAAWLVLGGDASPPAPPPAPAAVVATPPVAPPPVVAPPVVPSPAVPAVSAGAEGTAAVEPPSPNEPTGSLKKPRRRPQDEAPPAASERPASKPEVRTGPAATPPRRDQVTTPAELKGFPGE